MTGVREKMVRLEAFRIVEQSLDLPSFLQLR